MAIGSDPEIGKQFTTWGEMDEAARKAWFDHIRVNWGHNLMAGYATLHYPSRDGDGVRSQAQ